MTATRTPLREACLPITSIVTGVSIRATRLPRTSKSQDRLNHRHPAVHTCVIRSKGSGIRRAVHPHQFGVKPQTLGRQEVPLETGGILVRVAKLSEDLGATSIHSQLPGNDKIARRQFKAVVEGRGERNWPIGFEVV